MKKYRYRFEGIRIKSDVPLTEEQQIKIVNIVNEVMEQYCYDSCYHISKNIFNNMDCPISEVKTKYTYKKLFNIKLYNYNIK